MSKAKENLQRAISDLEIAMVAVFIPWSKSRSSRSLKQGAHVTERSLNWRVTLKRNGREILTTDYTAGIGHAPSYKQGVRMTLDSEAALLHETERGTVAKPSANLRHVFSGKPIAADICDVVYSLVSDARAIDYPSFEAWASDYGYDVDSRKAEATYRACLEIGLALRASLGDSGFAKLREACNGY
jgi:hypothetical protein